MRIRRYPMPLRPLPAGAAVTARQSRASGAMGLDLSSLTSSVTASLPGDLSQGLSTVEGSVASQVLSNPAVQAAAAGGANQAAANSLANFILQNETAIGIGAVILVSTFMAYVLLGRRG